MLSAARLIGRERELGELEREYQRAAAGEFRAVLLLGDAGVGKTRLARELIARKRSRALGLWGRGHPLGGTTSFGIWSEALERHLRSLPQEQMLDLCGGFLDDLATLLRSVAAVRPTTPDFKPQRSRLLAALALLTANLAKRAPVVLLVDDAHDADPSSWEALAYVARDLSDARLLALVVARPFELGELPLATEVLSRLEQDGALRRLNLESLDSGSLGELAEATIEDTPARALVDWLAERSRGNPLFALGLLEALIEEGADLAAPRLRFIPAGVAEHVATRLNGLDEEASRALEWLATFGRRVELRDLNSLDAFPAERQAAVLERLAQARLVVEDERGRDVGYEIAHPLVQEAIYRRIGAARRRDMHRRVGRALTAEGRLGEAAPHFARGADVGDEEAIEALGDAVREAEAGESYREALTLLDALVQLVPRGDRRWLVVLRSIRSQAEWVVDHRADVHAVLGIKAMNAIELALGTTPDPAPRAIVKFRLANFLGWGSGDLEQAQQACGEARSLFERAGDRGSALLAQNELCWLHGLRGDYAAMEQGARAVAEVAEAEGQRFALLQALGAQAFAAGFRGRFDQAVSAWQRSNALARQGKKAYRLTVGLVGFAVVLAEQGRSADAVQALEEARSAYPGWRDSILPEWEVIVHWFAGDFHRALSCAKDAASLGVGELSKRRAIGVAFAALAALEASEPEQARGHLARTRRSFESRDWQFFSRYCGHAQGMLDWAEGRRAEACAGLRDTAARVLATGAQPFAALVLVDLAEVAAAHGEPGLLAEAAGQLEAIAAEVDRDLYRGLAALASAWAALAGGHRDRGAASARAAVDLLSTTGCRAFQARALHVLGRSLADTDRAGALEALRQAAALYEASGALWRLDDVRSVLRSLGGRGRRAATAALGAAALSRRERQVAKLAAQGQTAAAIAARLSIGERTVETHLANVYAKLGVRSKIDLVRRASEFALNP